ncbi:MAG: efflux RND transporter permease subunit [Pseudomonadota bacterium]|nr:efflux RND transporter permease subunit [Pseudomonadota bacterium]
MSRMDAFVNRCSELLLGWRKPLSVLFTAATLLFAWSATSIRLDPGFLKLIPIEHPYMQTMMSYMKDFSGANTILVNLRWKGEGDIYNPEFMDAMRKATDEVFFIPGINRTAVSSIYTPSTYYIEITEEGFTGEPVVPAKFSNKQEELDRVRHNVKLSGQIGLLVSNDGKSALIRANLLDYDPDKPQDEQRVDYWEVQHRLEEIRGRFENSKKYLYKLKADQAPLKAGDVVAEGYVDLGLMQAMQTFKKKVQIEGEDAQTIIVSGGDVSVETVDNPEYSADIEVNIIGFARLLGDVIKGLLGVFAFFGLAFLITLVLLYYYSRSVRLTVVALVVALLPVLWLLGTLPLIGFGVDPMSILVPFLIFSIGVSHAVQMTSAWRNEVVHGADSVQAAHTAFRKLFIPGAVALLTNALGFAVIMFIDIPIVHELGITACIGVLLMIITNKMILPIILTRVNLEESCRRHHSTKKQMGSGPFGGVFRLIARCAEPKAALGVFAVSAVLLVGATVLSRDMVIGDLGRGVPELRPDSRYNLDNDVIGDNYDIGTDLLTVIAEAKDFEGDSCLHYEVTGLIDQFELYLRGVDGVRSVTSVAGIGKLVISAFNEGNPRWRALPRSQTGLSTGSKAFDPNLGLNNEGCKAIQVMIFTNNHDGTTVAHVVAEIKKFIEAHPTPGVTLRLATGNVGVMAATNEAVADAEETMLLAIFGALTLLCLITFRSIKATLCVLVPLALVSICCNALMAALGIGLKVATLPVVALGVGVGVDYGIYLFEQIQHEMRDHNSTFAEAFEAAMRQRGSAAVFTAITMAIGVGTWTLSALKLQADMGLLLAFMFLVNMLGAVCLLPALGAWFYRKKPVA